MGPSSKCNEDCHIDIIEQDIELKYPGLLRILLRDRTTGRNIIWACDEYRKYGEQYTADHEITIKQITGKNTKLIRPRIAKSREECRNRTRKSAEVFTPSWICAEMNNYCDEQWFGVANLFNTLTDKTWTTNPNKIPFETPSDWQRYVDSRRLEITCGEAPYLTSRYDTTTGDYIPVERRIGILDRKLRVVNENTTDESEWLKWVIRAYCATYGYEYQGDNLLLARENLIWTFIDNYKCRFNKAPDLDTLKTIARIISWNIWQMDGLTTCVPCFGDERCRIQLSLFGGLIPDEGQPQLCQIKNWRSKTIHNFQDLKGAKSMKFDFCIGNPPYQETVENTSDKPIYNDFMNGAYLIADKVELITPARFLFNAGKTPKEWNKKMLSDEHLKVLAYNRESKKYFPTTSINGGIVITYRDATKTYGAINYFCPDTEIKTIVDKVTKHVKFTSIKHLVYLQNKFDLEALYTDYPSTKAKISSDGNEKRIVSSAFDNLTEVFLSERHEKDDVQICGLSNRKRILKWISPRYLDESSNINMYKVLLSAADGASGTIGNPIPARITGKPKVLDAGIGYTQTFISIGAFKTKKEAESLYKYLLTKFARFMVGTIKATNGLKIEVWANVPSQDFTDKSDIDWSKSIQELNLQLYKKYKLTDEEIDFIESHIEEMAE